MTLAEGLIQNSGFEQYFMLFLHMLVASVLGAIVG